MVLPPHMVNSELYFDVARYQTMMHTTILLDVQTLAALLMECGSSGTGETMLSIDKIVTPEDLKSAIRHIVESP